MKKAEAESCASASLSVKMPFTAATSGSISEVMKPQAKQRTVTAEKAARAVDRPPGAADVWLGNSIGLSSSPIILQGRRSNRRSDPLQPVATESFPAHHRRFLPLAKY